jgi:hypothetical protein
MTFFLPHITQAAALLTAVQTVEAGKQKIIYKVIFSP